MKDFEVVFNKSLFKGLRRTDKSRRGSGTLAECFNIAPAEGKIRPHEYLTSLDEDISWGSVDLYWVDHNWEIVTTNGSAKILI